jgi:hypothetical protein
MCKKVKTLTTFITFDGWLSHVKTFQVKSWANIWIFFKIHSIESKFSKNRTNVQPLIFVRTKKILFFYETDDSLW